MNRKIICLLAALCMTVTMSGCVRKGNEEQTPSPTLPPAAASWAAPDGDRVIREPGDYLYYLPEEGESRLVTHSIHLEEASLNDTVTALAEAVLKAASEGGAVSAQRELTLARSRNMEISSGICTINLSSSALLLSSADYYKVSLALATTLCRLEEIKYVNVLTANQSVALDSAGILAMGSLSGHAGENLTVLWEQAEARRTPQGGNPGATPLDAQATIYYPLTEGRGIACESRRVSFEGQSAGQLASALMDAMSSAVKNRIGSADTPDLWEYMVHEPVSSELEEGGKLITLSFRGGMQELADGWNTDIACLAAAITWTLTTFVPGTAAVCFRVGDKPVTELKSDRFRVDTVLGGLMRRSIFEPFLTGSTAVFFEANGKLIRVEKPVQRESADSPRTQLNALLQGPDRLEKEKGITSPLPPEIREDDLLGIAAEGDTVLVNLSSRFREAIGAQGPEKEMLLCYAMVNTLCVNTGKKRVCFFFEGVQQEWIAGEIYWAGEFLFNPEI